MDKVKVSRCAYVVSDGWHACSWVSWWNAFIIPSKAQGHEYLCCTAGTSYHTTYGPSRNAEACQCVKLATQPAAG